ncbi:hypothetical protein PIB30_086503 [Stylosanthes scabra]|uniref:Uncharacterized protein n=1 Tax=Stylosanthes scabra TaxID=79078 RepID=A0ABU6XSJ1_9FABA|nr:hypothetical protein [Stylosanthes scabra]
MAKKKSCQNVRVPRVLSVVERELYDWVDEEIFTQPSVIKADALPELRRKMRLTADRAAEGDYVLEAAGPSDRLPFWAQEDRVHFLWVYSAPFLWVYWNAEVGDFRVTTLDPLETLAFDFLQSLPVGLGKKSNFKCRWILDHSDVEVGAFLDSLLKDMEKYSRFDRLMQRIKEAEKRVLALSFRPLRPKLPLPVSQPLALFPLLMFLRRKRKVSEASAEEATLGGDSAWKHKVNPIDRAFPPDYNFRAALDAGLTNVPIREVLEPLVLQQLLGTAQFLACQLTACLQVGIEKTFAAKVQLEKELVAVREEAEVLTAERDSALAAPLLHAKIKFLIEDLQHAEGEWLSATARMEEVERKAKTALDEAEAAVHWRDEWRLLGEEAGEMVQETFEILMDQVRHLNPAIDYLMITLDTRWDPKAKRIYNPKAEAQDQPEPAVEQPDPRAEEQHAEEVVEGKGGVCLT